MGDSMHTTAGTRRVKRQPETFDKICPRPCVDPDSKRCQERVGVHDASHWPVQVRASGRDEGRFANDVASGAYDVRHWPTSPAWPQTPPIRAYLSIAKEMKRGAGLRAAVFQSRLKKNQDGGERCCFEPSNLTPSSLRNVDAPAPQARLLTPTSRAGVDDQVGLANCRLTKAGAFQTTFRRQALEHHRRRHTWYSDA
jgi:hypothetical protein